MKKLIKVLIVLFLNPTNMQANAQLENPTKSKGREVWVNVFIHGIVRPIVDIGDMIQIGRQNLKKTRYKYTTNYVRKHNLARHSQATQDVGLHQIKMEPNPDNQGSRAMVAVFKLIKKQLGTEQDKELYYTFGWSGLISYHSRQKAAYFLYHKLIRLVESLRSKGLEPKIRLITYSHGGNVALQMANFDPWNRHQSKLSIAELVCLAVPVQKDNDNLIRHPMFEKIYHFYSNGDIPQKLDFVSTSFGTSYRRYADRKCFEIPEKLTQIQVHFQKNTHHKASLTRKEGYSQSGFDPNHIEMWSFGWTSKGYRRDAPIFPLPTTALTPALIAAIESQPNLGRNLEADIDQDKGEITIVDRDWATHRTLQTIKVPFMTKAQFHELQQAAWTRRPNHDLKSLSKAVASSAIRFATNQRKLRHCRKTINSSCQKGS